MQCCWDLDRGLSQGLLHARIPAPLEADLKCCKLLLFAPSLILELAALLMLYCTLEGMPNVYFLLGSSLYLLYTLICLHLVKHLFTGSCCKRFVILAVGYVFCNISAICIGRMMSWSSITVASEVCHVFSMWWWFVTFFIFFVNFCSGSHTYVTQIDECKDLETPLVSNYSIG